MKTLIRSHPAGVRIMYNHNKAFYEYQRRIPSVDFKRWETLKYITNEAWKRGVRF